METLGKQDIIEDARTLETILAKNHVRATKTSAQSIPNNTVPFTTIIYNVEEYDDGGEYNPATGVFTASRSGRLLVGAGILYEASTAWGPTETALLSVHVAGVRKADIGREYDFSGANVNVAQVGSTTVQVTEGQTVTVRAYQDSGSARNIFSGGSAGTANFVTFDWLS